MGSRSNAAAQANQLYAYLRMTRPQEIPLRPKDQALLDACTQFAFGRDRELVGWSIGEGRPVFLVHGWGSRGAQMAPLAHSLAKSGYQAVFFDAGSHGASGARDLGFDRFAQDAASLQDWMECTPFAWIGHSAGALGMMSGRLRNEIAAERFVCIAAPMYPYVPIDRMRASGATESVLERVKPMIADQFGFTWSELEDARMWQTGNQPPLLLVYDQDDDVVAFDDGPAIQSVWHSAEVHMTSGLGHNRVVSNVGVAERVAEFLQAV